MASSSVPPDLTPRTENDPQHIGGYRIAGRIGAGGMGVVYAGVDTSGHAVAVKVVKRELAADPDFRARFTREVDLMRRVHGTCLPAFFGADTQAETPWLATQYVSGLTLRQHLDRHGPMDAGMLAGFAAGCAEALAAVHAAGIVHRDLKPGNVILAPDGPKVLDFGIARALDESAITRTGGLLGTPGWVAPEQYGGAPPHPTSDMFAWGGLVAFAATGRAPFGAGHPNAIAQRVLHEEPDLEGLPEPLAPLVRAALDKDPNQRPAAARALQAATTLTPPPAGEAPTHEPTQALTQMLQAHWRVEPGTGPSAWAPMLPRRPWWRRTATVATAAVLALVLVTSASWLAGRYLASDGGGDPEGTAAEEQDEPEASEGGDGDAGAPPGMQEVSYRELTLQVPEEWQVHTYEHEYNSTGGGPSDSEEITVLQTDPAQTCELDENFLFGSQCASVWLLGPVSRQLGYALGGQVDETRPFHLAGEPSECVQDVELLTEEEATAQGSQEEELDLDGVPVLHQTWLVNCWPDVSDPGPFNYYKQQMWRLPEVMVVDNHQTEGLAEIMQNAQINQ